eukprot:2511976-Rhodomonas_salina.2
MRSADPPYDDTTRVRRYGGRCPYRTARPGTRRLCSYAYLLPILYCFPYSSAKRSCSYAVSRSRIEINWEITSGCHLGPTSAAWALVLSGVDLRHALPRPCQALHAAIQPVSQPICLRVCYVMSGTDIVYMPTMIFLRACCGTDLAYALKRVICDARYSASVCCATRGSSQCEGNDEGCEWYAPTRVLRHVRY